MPTPSHWKSKLTSSLFILPYLIAFLAFTLIPIIYGFIISLKQYNLLDPVHPFVGFDNYRNIFTNGTQENDLFFIGMKATLKFVVFSVPFLVIVGLGFALLLNALPAKLRSLFRSIYFIPYAVSATVMAVIWKRMFDVTGGFINLLLAKVGIREFDPVPWLLDTPFVWFALVIATLWWTIGFNMIIFVNALNGVPEDLYEAAKIDGANGWDRLKSITLPFIRPVLIFVLITSTIASYNIFAQPNLMSNAGDETKVLLMGILQTAYTAREIGSASAMAILMGLTIMIVSIIQFKVTSRKE
ncbi:ABC transporter permease [Paenibacillus sp. Soil766]|uniref:carbohydrate ABC transporter permease n=1 Tax=Paenibacillus sp. Soil766 TaxID=1736404 RepID=UPI00070B2D0D|nr:sugar ABC transporter permease [Paenibacillus sp. Soil766]KRE93351.1 ABC transporter permease [Paenibacillus sp. Soil766]